jgi:hypothetical protein
MGWQLHRPIGGFLSVSGRGDGGGLSFPRSNRLRKLEASVLAKRAIPTSVAERSEPLLLLGELVRRLVCPKGRGSYEQHSSALSRKCRSV